MTPLDAVLLAIVEGVTEFLPVSSTGHLILAQHLLGIEETVFVKTFDIGIQLGAILAVVALYARSLLNVTLLKKLFVAFVPTGVIGFTLYPFIKGFLLGNEWIVVSALALGGAVLILLEIMRGASEEMPTPPADISYRDSFLIGLFQSLAVVPGVSRSGATIAGGLLLGIPRVTITEFSFLLAVPTMAAATGYDLLKSAGEFTASNAGLFAIGFVVSFAVALVSIRWLIRIVQRHTFIPFGVYRILIALVFAFFLL